jgi:hypothetical protein
LHDYLNGVKKYQGKGFYDRFSPADRARIAQTYISTNNNPWYGTKGGSTVNDYIFLLSIEEVVKYFGDSGDLKTRKDWKWENGKDVLAHGSGYYINDQYNSARIATDKAGAVTRWWLRSPGFNSGRVADVNCGGRLIVDGNLVDHDFAAGGGVRPALWFNL